VIDPVVDPAWVHAHEGRIVLADVRWSLTGPSGRGAYREGHLPGAVYVDLDSQLAAPATDADGRHPLPDPAAFATAMSACGIGDDSVVVAYDDARGSSAARLVWMLRVLGRDAALLDGGLAGWDGVLAQGDEPVEPRTFTPHSWPADKVVDADLTERLAQRGVPVLDARDEGRFTGESPAAVDPRPGHLPGAQSAPWADHLDESGRLLPDADLREYYAERGVDTEGPGAAPIVYCGSGVTSCLNLLALEQIGVAHARLYAGSWSQWASDPQRPVETGPHVRSTQA
jgi:thiosulfate/3-mercaptopyruvate sulfurtransferase